MREIKFRAWDDLHKKMYSDVGMLSNIWYRGHFLSNGFEVIVTTPQIKVMQYTGLKDKNGKEIYEGDIIQTHFDKTNQYEAYDEIGEVVFVSLEWKIENKKHGNYYGFYSHGEVIGNIYENSELLENN